VTLVRRIASGVLHKVPRDHVESDDAFRRRQRVVAATGVVGSVVLNRTFKQRPDSRAFYLHTAAAAATWVAGGLSSGRLHLGRQQVRRELTRPVLAPAATGAAAFAGLYAAGVVAKRIPFLEGHVQRVLTFAEQGDLLPVYVTTLGNGLAEEVFFRGAVYAAVPEPHQVAVTTAAYTLATVQTKNPALVLAAAAMGTLFALQRRASGGIQAPMITHVTWSALVLRFLPPLFGRDTPGG
jgi:membrane protease YdiL (CAAX protease family)